MAKTSAGLLMYRMRDGALEVLLVHPGGPFWKRKDAGAWSIPKGEYEAGEDPLAAACREFQEETGVRPEGPFQPAGVVNAMDLAIARGHAHGYYYRSFAKIFGDLQKVA